MSSLRRAETHECMVTRRSKPCSLGGGGYHAHPSCMLMHGKHPRRFHHMMSIVPLRLPVRFARYKPSFASPSRRSLRQDA